MSNTTSHSTRMPNRSIRATTRSAGREWRIAVWLFRHPAFALIPVLGLWAVILWGATAVLSFLGGIAVGLLVWWRAHPPTYDRWIAPRVRATWRRWTTYRGRRWQTLLEDCDLTREHRRTGAILVPRVLRVRSAMPTVDTLYVRVVRGQDLRTWVDKADALAEAFIAHRVAITRHRPGVLAVIVEREMPFDRVIPAPEIRASSAEVDLTRLDIGDNEHGEPFTINALKPTLTAGGTGAGKGSVLWSGLRAMGPMIRDGLVRISMIDLKGGTETDRGEALFFQWATTMDQAIVLLTAFRDRMRARQAWMREHKIRRCTVTPATPAEILEIDELAMLTAYGDRTQVRQALQLLAEIMTQGRAALFTVHGYVQEPSKDVVDVRELFIQRLCLGVTAASHVDMVLGDGARERGALADEIPGDERHAGIGFIVDATSRLPIRFRAAFVTDTEIDELATTCSPRTKPSNANADTNPTATGGDVADGDVADGDVIELPTWLRPDNNNDSDRDDETGESGLAS